MEQYKHTFDHYLDFRGRASHREFLVFLLTNIAVIALLYMVMQWLSIESGVMMLLLVLLVPPTLTLVSRRLHDLGHSGKWALMLLVPVLNLAFLVFLAALKGTSANNIYGGPPAI